jgi:hypothetical protein
MQGCGSASLYCGSGSSFHFIADPDPARPDPDPASKNKADPCGSRIESAPLLTCKSGQIPLGKLNNAIKVFQQSSSILYTYNLSIIHMV